MNKLIKPILAATAVLICCWGAAEVPGLSNNTNEIYRQLQNKAAGRSKPSNI